MSFVVRNERAEPACTRSPRPIPTNVFGCLAYDGPPKMLAEMDAGIVAEAKRRSMATDTGILER